MTYILHRGMSCSNGDIPNHPDMGAKCRGLYSFLFQEAVGAPTCYDYTCIQSM